MSLSEQVRALECERDRLRAEVRELARRFADREPLGQVDLVFELRRDNEALKLSRDTAITGMHSAEERLAVAEKRAELFRLQRESLRAQIASHAKNCTGKKGDIVDTITITQRDNAGKLTCEGCPQLQRSGCARGWSDRVLVAGGATPDYFIPGAGRCYGPGIFDVVQRPLEEMLEAWERDEHPLRPDSITGAAKKLCRCMPLAPAEDHPATFSVTEEAVKDLPVRDPVICADCGRETDHWLVLPSLTSDGTDRVCPACAKEQERVERTRRVRDAHAVNVAAARIGVPEQEEAVGVDEERLRVLTARLSELDVENQRLYEELTLLRDDDDANLCEEDPVPAKVSLAEATVEARIRAKTLENNELASKIYMRKKAQQAKGGE